MVSNRWQKKQTIVQHTSLALVCTGTLYWFELQLPPWQELLLIALTCMVVLGAGRYLNRRYADTLVRVIKKPDDVTTRIVQRALNASYLPFSRRSGADAVRFIIRDRGLTVVVQDCPLNVPIDNHIRPTIATKVEIRGLNPANAPVADRLCQAIESSLAASTG